MKYHKHIIIKTSDDLGDEDGRNYVYTIYNENGCFIDEALTLSTAKDFIDNNYDQNYL